jgi:hypothetical protein
MCQNYGSEKDDDSAHMLLPVWGEIQMQRQTISSMVTSMLGELQSRKAIWRGIEDSLRSSEAEPWAGINHTFKMCSSLFFFFLFVF